MGFLALFTFATLAVVYLLALGREVTVYCSRCRSYYGRESGHFCPSPSRQENARYFR